MCAVPSICTRTLWCTSYQGHTIQIFVVGALAPHIYLNFLDLQFLKAIRKYTLLSTLYIWRELRTQIFLNLKLLKLSISKFYQLCTCKSYDFSPNLEVIAQKMRLPRPWEVSSSQGRGRPVFQAKTFKFGEKLYFSKVNNW